MTHEVPHQEAHGSGRAPAHRDLRVRRLRQRRRRRLRQRLRGRRRRWRPVHDDAARRTSATPTSTPAPRVPRRLPASSDAEFEEVGPETGSPDAQVSYINTVAQQGKSALILSANDPEALCDAIEEARSADVKVVTFDADTNPECRDLFINQATAEGIAAKQLELIAEEIGGSGEIAILSASANATNQNAWIEMMEEELADEPGLRRHRARRHRLRRRRGPEVVRPDRGAAAEPPRPQGHHLAHHGRHRRRGALPVGLGVQGQGRADRPRHPEPDA